MNDRGHDRIGISQKAIIVNEQGKLLALHRTKTAPTRPLCWDLPGGDLEIGEEPYAAMRREIKEEVGLTVTDLAPFDVVAQQFSDAYWVTVGYYAKTSGDVAVTLSYEHDEFRWLTPKEFLVLESGEKLKKLVNTYLKRYGI